MNLIENKTFEEIQIGDSASLRRVLTKQDIDLFAVMSGDVNPAHVDEEYARSSIFHDIIAHGMYGGSLISTVLGTQLPGPGTIYLSQTLEFKKPVKIGDTLNVLVRVKEKKEKGHIVVLSCRCTNQRGREVISGEAVVMAPEEKISRPRAKLPEVTLNHEDDGSRWFAQLVALQSNTSPIKVGVVHPVDPASLGGAVDAAEEGIIKPVFIGPEHKIKAAAEEAHIDLSSYEIVATEHSHAAGETAVRMVREGKLEALMKGKLHTDELMHFVLDKETGLRTGRRMSHVFVIDFPSYHKPLFLTDAAINIRPNLQAKKDIVQNAIDLFNALNMGAPKVAIVSAVETVNEEIPSTLDATALCKMAERGQITGGILYGPLGFDNAISKEAAASKNIVSQVAGDADIIVVPDIEAGNILYKQIRYMSNIEGAGIVLGARVPIILTSRAAGRGMTRKASCALAAAFLKKRSKSD